MKYLCLAYEEEQKLNALSRAECDALRGWTCCTGWAALTKRAEPIDARWNW